MGQFTLVGVVGAVVTCLQCGWMLADAAAAEPSSMPLAYGGVLAQYDAKPNMAAKDFQKAIRVGLDWVRERQSTEHGLMGQALADAGVVTTASKHKLRFTHDGSTPHVKVTHNYEVSLAADTQHAQHTSATADTQHSILRAGCFLAFRLHSLSGRYQLGYHCHHSRAGVVARLARLGWRSRLAQTHASQMPCWAAAAAAGTDGSCSFRLDILWRVHV